MVHKNPRSASVSTCSSLIYPERPLYPPAPIDFYPGRFHQLTKPFSRNSIVCTSIQNGGGAPSKAKPRRKLAPRGAFQVSLFDFRRIQSFRRADCAVCVPNGVTGSSDLQIFRSSDLQTF